MLCLASTTSGSTYLEGIRVPHDGVQPLPAVVGPVYCHGTGHHARCPLAIGREVPVHSRLCVVCLLGTVDGSGQHLARYVSSCSPRNEWPHCYYLLPLDPVL